MDTSITLKTVSQDQKKNTTTLTNVNPNASDATLLEYAQKMASLSTDTYAGAEKVEKTSLDGATVKLPRNVSIGVYGDGFETIQPVLTNSIHEVGIRYQGPSDPCYITFQRPPEGFAQPFELESFEADDEDPLYFAFRGTLPFGTESTPWTMQVYVPESDTHLAETFTITIQGGDS